jgi:stress response protein YsnF
VGKHTVNQGTTRVHRFVVETPVEQQVSLSEERVVVERRKPATDAVTGETFTEITVEMIETAEVPVVAKGVRVREEIVIRKERTERVTTVRDTVRRDELRSNVPMWRSLLPESGLPSLTAAGKAPFILLARDRGELPHRGLLS